MTDRPSNASEDILNSINDNLRKIAEGLYESCRPRLFFDILPNNLNTGILDVVIRNSGGSPAHDITFKFEPDLYYYDGSSLSKLPIFKDLSLLDQGQEIRFFYGAFSTIIKRGGAYGEKKTTVTITYKDSTLKPYTEKFLVDLERYKEILVREERTLNDVFDEIRDIKRILSSGLLIKTLRDVKEERNAYMHSLDQRKKSR